MLGFVHLVSAKGLVLLEAFGILSQPPYNLRRQPRAHLTEPTIESRARNRGGQSITRAPWGSMLPQKFRGLVGTICLLCP